MEVSCDIAYKVVDDVDFEVVFEDTEVDDIVDSKTLDDWWELSNREFDADMIVDGLWLGSEDAAMNDEELKKHNIKYILTVAEEIDPEYLDVRFH